MKHKDKDLRREVFDFTDYKAFLYSIMDSPPFSKRGTRTRLAQAMGTHSAYLTHVLKGSAHFTPEQAEKGARFFGLVGHEFDFFILLVLFGRAGTDSLRSYFQVQMNSKREQWRNLKNRLSYDSSLGPREQEIYTSTWLYSAVDILLPLLKGLDLRELSKRLGVTFSEVQEVTDFLREKGLVEIVDGKFRHGVKSLHLPADSSSISKHHWNWRLKAMQSIERRDPTELHYTSVVSFSAADAPRIREVLVKAIEEVRNLVRASGEEVAYCYLVDLFKLIPIEPELT